MSTVENSVSISSADCRDVADLAKRLRLHVLQMLHRAQSSHIGSNLSMVELLAGGQALAGKWDERPYRVFAMLSDGECDEGTNWEAALFAPHHKLDNLVVIIDYNKIQSLTYCRDTLNLEPFADKFRAFGWSV